MGTVFFTVLGPPKGKARPRFSGGHAYTPTATRTYESQVRTAYNDVALGVRFTGPVRMEILAFYPIPKSAGKARRAAMEAGNVQPVKKPDWDNLGKIICDALNGLAWRDDAQVVDAHVVKRYGVEPMVHVRMEGEQE